MTISHLIFVSAAFVAVAAVVYAALSARWLLQHKLARRVSAALRQQDGAAVQPPPNAAAANWLERVCRPLVGRAAASESDADGSERSKVKRPGPMRIALALLPLAVAALVAACGLAPPGMCALAGSIASSLCYIAPSCVASYFERRRLLGLRRGIPDLLDVMVVCLDAGMSIAATIQRVTDEIRLAHPVLANELFVLQRDIEVGSTIEAAFARFARRTRCDEIRAVSNLIKEGQRTGTPLSDALRVQAEGMRDCREQEAEERAQKAAVKILFPTLLLIFPALFIVLAGPAAIKIHEAFSK